MLHVDLQTDALARRLELFLELSMVVSVWSNDTNMIIVNMPLDTVWLTSSMFAFCSAMVVATWASRPWLSGPSAVTMTVVRMETFPRDRWAGRGG